MCTALSQQPRVAAPGRPKSHLHFWLFRCADLCWYWKRRIRCLSGVRAAKKDLKTNTLGVVFTMHLHWPTVMESAVQIPSAKNAAFATEVTGGHFTRALTSVLASNHVPDGQDRILYCIWFIWHIASDMLFGDNKPRSPSVPVILRGHRDQRKTTNLCIVLHAGSVQELQAQHGLDASYSVALRKDFSTS